jgi:hypothetical protein
LEKGEKESNFHQQNQAQASAPSKMPLSAGCNRALVVVGNILWGMPLEITKLHITLLGKKLIWKEFMVQFSLYRVHSSSQVIILGSIPTWSQ